MKESCDYSKEELLLLLDIKNKQIDELKKELVLEKAKYNESSKA